MLEAFEPPLNGDENCFQIFAVMCRPAEPATLLAEFALKLDSEGWELTDDMRGASVNLAALEHIHPGGSRTASEVARGAAVAGLTLTLLFWLYRGGVSEPSLEKAQWLAGQQAKRFTHSGGKKVGFSRAAVKGYWAEYKRVAHLWAAHQILDMRSSEKAALLPRIAEDPEKFLATAKSIQLFADDYRAARTRAPEPLLPQNAWRIGPLIDSLPLKAPPLPTELLDDLARYRNG